ncbi:ABC transporter substrate-binding protein [Chelativorans sp.]|uniref:ABC transporter substrate-binding protein n=1 Tax=Chelativorans sp. TaxID=2203393 RepID=UPI002811B541|nr:ABC transporter substrate-binding protein [Chelativorans sp.]
MTKPSNLSVTRRQFIAGSAALAGSLALPGLLRAQEKRLSINSWGGSWLDSARKHLFDPFTEQTGIRIETVSPVSFAKLAAQVETGVYEFDVTTLGAAELVRANQNGLLEPLQETYPGGLYQNGMASHAFATVMGWRSDKYGSEPKGWADFWDVQRFPGTRSLQRYPARVLPIALLADGVTKEDLYPLDVDRAFASLDRIKDHIIVWWTAGEQSAQILRDGEVDMIGIWNTRFFAAQDAGAPVEMTWNEAILDKAYWVVAKGTPNVDAAKEFVAFATSAKPLAGFAAAQQDGPLNPAALELIDPAEAERMPTNSRYADQVVSQDMERLGIDPAELAERFEEWVLS